MVFTKQSEWAYEKEARVVLLSDKEADFVILPHSMIKRVIVGSRATRSLINQVSECIANTDITLVYAIYYLYFAAFPDVYLNIYGFNIGKSA